MEFLDEESRPRFLFQSRTIPQSETQPPLKNLHKPTLIVSLSLSVILFALSVFYFQSDPFKSIFLWFSLSFLIGPFAPPSLTAGDIRVGLGPTLQPPPPVLEETQEPDPPKRSRFKPRKSDQDHQDYSIRNVFVEETEKPRKGNENGKGKDGVLEEESEWTEGDFELLKKLVVKYPVGMPGRWEAVAEAFSGRHKVESVVKMAKGMGERKVSDSDSFSKFLKDRKPVDKRVDEVIENERGSGGSWGSAEDVALLNALKAFPKDVPMRWEKITAAVPGRSKAACMKRVADLKRDFRSSKASSEAQ